MSDVALAAAPSGEFFEDLLARALVHPAVQHPFLERFAREPLGRGHLVAHATQHYLYSRWFARNLAAAAANVPDEHARTLLVQNMYEEVGEPARVRDRLHLMLLAEGIASADDVAQAVIDAADRSDHDPVEALIARGALRRADVAQFLETHERSARESTHPALFRRYLRALGVSPETIASLVALPETEAFVREYEDVCRRAPWFEALGALGLGTECVVPSIYTFLLRGIEASGQLASGDYLFWTIHVHCDEGHGRNIISALEPFAHTPAAQDAIERGAQRVLDARARWFDGLERHVFA